MIIPVYQPQGTSSHQLAQQWGEKYGQKATHTGTLDPMAEGVLVILTGDDRFQKAVLSDSQKTYLCEILWGVETDSLDVLGLVNTQTSDDCSHIQPTIDRELLSTVIQSFVGTYAQEMPQFSAKRFAGKSLFDFARQGKSVVRFQQQVELFSATIITERMIQKTDLHQSVVKKISNVTGDFRQPEIVERWEQFLGATKNETFLITELEIETSKRFYVRALVRDIAKKVGVSALTYSIIRTKNGSFTIDSCQH